MLVSALEGTIGAGVPAKVFQFDASNVNTCNDQSSVIYASVLHIDRIFLSALYCAK